MSGASRNSGALEGLWRSAVVAHVVVCACGWCRLVAVGGLKGVTEWVPCSFATVTAHALPYALLTHAALLVGLLNICRWTVRAPPQSVAHR